MQSSAGCSPARSSGISSRGASGQRASIRPKGRPDQATDRLSAAQLGSTRQDHGWDAHICCTELGAAPSLPPAPPLFGVSASQQPRSCTAALQVPWLAAAAAPTSAASRLQPWTLHASGVGPTAFIQNGHVPSRAARTWAQPKECHAQRNGHSYGPACARACEAWLSGRHGTRLPTRHAPCADDPDRGVHSPCARGLFSLGGSGPGCASQPEGTQTWRERGSLLRRLYGGGGCLGGRAGGDGHLGQDLQGLAGQGPRVGAAAGRWPPCWAGAGPAKGCAVQGRGHFGRAQILFLRSLLSTQLTHLATRPQGGDASG